MEQHFLGSNYSKESSRPKICKHPLSHSFSGSWNKNQWIHGIFSCFSVILFWVAFNSLLVMTHDVRCCCCIERKHFSYNCFLHYLPSCWWCFRILFSHPFITFLTWLWYIANVISWQSHFTRTCNLSCSICFCEGTYLLIIQMFSKRKYSREINESVCDFYWSRVFAENNSTYTHIDWWDYNFHIDQ